MNGFQLVFIVSIAFMGIAFIRRKKVVEKELVEGFKTNGDCAISDGTIIYRVEIKNELSFVVHNVIVTLMAYPKNCMELTRQKKKTITMIEPDKFEKLEFQFIPTKDHIEGQIQASVSYSDSSDELRTLLLRPLTIRFVCDLLNPTKMPVHQFDLLLSKMDAISEDVNFEVQAKILFERAKVILPAKNFYIIDTEKHVNDGLFTGAIRGFAEGKYTKKRIAIILTVSGASNVEQAVVKVQAHGDDLVMLPTAVHEVASELREMRKIPTSRQLIRYQQKLE